MLNEPLFWAGLAGARADDINTLESNYRSWKNHAQNLEGRVERISKASKAWRDEAIDNGASALVREEAFKEVTGKGVREYFGDQEIDKRMDEARPAIREGYGQ